MRTTAAKQKSPRPKVDIRLTPLTARDRAVRTAVQTKRDRAAFDALQAFAVADAVEAIALAPRVNDSVASAARRIQVPYGMATSGDQPATVHHQLLEWFTRVQAGQCASLVVREGISGFELACLPSKYGLMMDCGVSCSGLGQFWVDVAELMVRVGPALRKCASCGALFIRRKRQIYCTRRCSQVARSAKWYRRHRATLRRKRQGDYARQARSRTYPGARVQSYPRVH